MFSSFDSHSLSGNECNEFRLKPPNDMKCMNLTSVKRLNTEIIESSNMNRLFSKLDFLSWMDSWFCRHDPNFTQAPKSFCHLSQNLERVIEVLTHRHGSESHWFCRLNRINDMKWSTGSMMFRLQKCPSFAHSRHFEAHEWCSALRCSAAAIPARHISTDFKLDWLPFCGPL